MELLEHKQYIALGCLTVIPVALWVLYVAIPKLKLLAGASKLVAVTDELRMQLKRQEDHTRHMNLSRDVLSVLNEPSDINVALTEVIKLIRSSTGFDDVGIRLRLFDDYPYAVSEGFSDDFILQETHLKPTKDFCYDSDGSIKLECTCGLVLQNKLDGLEEFSTPNGSIFINDSSEVTSIPPDLDPRLSPRNLCIHEGYQSVALMPIKDNNTIVGLLQINDKRRKAFQSDAIKSLELIASYIGTALVRKHIEKENTKLEKQFHHAQKME